MICIGTTLSACGGGGRHGAVIEPRPIGRELPVYRPAMRDSGRSTGPAFEQPTDSVTLRDAAALALLHSPALAAFAWEERAREARVVQAGRLPNPVIELLAEDLAAARPLRGVGGTAPIVQPQTTVQLSQVIELGGKRVARQKLAARTRDLATWDYETARMDVLTRVTHAFIDVVAAQELVALTTQTAHLVEQVQRSVGARVAAGVVSPIEETRSTVALALARVESNRAIRSLDASRRWLAAQWGATDARFAGAAGTLDVATALPPIAELQRRLTDNPDVARWAVEIMQRRAAVSVETSRRVPDVTVNAGYRRFSEPRASAYVIGASLPLPLFDWNGGAVTEARARLAKAYEERRAAQARVSAGLGDAFRALASAHDEVTALRTTVLPGSRQTFDAVTEGYRLGRFGFLDVLDAQRTLIAANGQYLRAFSDYHKAVADVERLIGVPLPGTNGSP